jgi:dTDP-4-amino-4,6-dideoxygalactose transaminase
LTTISKKSNLSIVEDAAQSIDAYYKDQPLGSIGQLASFSFHETKNIISGEGGMLVINDEQLIKRAEIIREKGTNRSAFFRGEVNKYGWVDVGSSFLPSDIIAAFLYAQLENIKKIQQQRIHIWNLYFKNLSGLAEQGHFTLPVIPDYATNNAHLFYLVCNNLDERTGLIEYLKKNKIHAVFHYLSLHKSEFYQPYHDGRSLPNADRFTDCLLRLPMYYELSDEQVHRVCDEIANYFKK